MKTSTSCRCADAIPEPDHRRGSGEVKGSRKRQQPGSRERGEHGRKVDRTNPYVRAMFTPEFIRFAKEILAEGD